MAQRPQFDSRQKFVVARGFKFAGRAYLEGQAFDWRSIGCSVRRLSQMYNARKLSMLDAHEPLEEVKPVVEKEVLDTSKTDAPAAKKADKPKLTDEEKKAKKAAKRKAARKAAKEANGE
jgi:hypothetical protein